MAGTHSFSFDRVFGPQVSQVDIFSEVAKPVVEGIIKLHDFFQECSTVSTGQSSAMGRPGRVRLSLWR